MIWPANAAQLKRHCLMFTSIGSLWDNHTVATGSTAITMDVIPTTNSAEKWFPQQEALSTSNQSSTPPAQQSQTKIWPNWKPGLKPSICHAKLQFSQRYTKIPWSKIRKLTHKPTTLAKHSTMQSTFCSKLSGQYKRACRMPSGLYRSLMSICLLRISATTVLDTAFQHLEVFRAYTGSCPNGRMKSTIQLRSTKAGFWTELSRLQLMKLGICLDTVIAFFMNVWWWVPIVYSKLTEIPLSFAQFATESYGNASNLTMWRGTKPLPNAPNGLA